MDSGMAENNADPSSGGDVDDIDGHRKMPPRERERSPSCGWVPDGPEEQSGYHEVVPDVELGVDRPLGLKNGKNGSRYNQCKRGGRGNAEEPDCRFMRSEPNPD